MNVNQALDLTLEIWTDAAIKEGINPHMPGRMLAQWMRSLVMALIDVDEPGQRLDQWPLVLERFIKDVIAQSSSSLPVGLARHALLVALIYRYWLLTTRIPLKKSDIARFQEIPDGLKLAQRVAAAAKTLQLNFILWRFVLTGQSAAFATHEEVISTLSGHIEGVAMIRLSLENPPGPRLALIHNHHVLDIPLGVKEHSLGVADSNSKPMVFREIQRLTDLFLASTRALPYGMSLIRIITPDTAGDKSYINAPFSPKVLSNMEYFAAFEVHERERFYSHLYLADGALQNTGDGFHVETPLRKDRPSIRIDHWFHSDDSKDSRAVSTNVLDFVGILKDYEFHKGWKWAGAEYTEMLNPKDATSMVDRIETEEFKVLYTLLRTTIQADASQRKTRRMFVQAMMARSRRDISLPYGENPVAIISQRLSSDIKDLLDSLETLQTRSLQRGEFPTVATHYGPEFVRVLNIQRQLRQITDTPAGRQYTIALLYRFWLTMMSATSLSTQSIDVFDSFTDSDDLVHRVLRSISLIHSSNYLAYLYAQNTLHFGYARVEDVKQRQYLDPRIHPSGSALLRISIDANEGFVGPCLTVRYDRYFSTGHDLHRIDSVYIDLAIVVKQNRLVLRHIGQAPSSIAIRDHITFVTNLKMETLDDVFAQADKSGIHRLVTPPSVGTYVPDPYGATYNAHSRRLLNPSGIWTHTPAPPSLDLMATASLRAEIAGDGFFTPDYWETH